MPCPCECSWKLKFCYGCFSSFIGLSVFFSFFQMGNPHAAGWGLASGFFALFYAIYIWRTIRPVDIKDRYQPTLLSERGGVIVAGSGIGSTGQTGLINAGVTLPELGTKHTHHEIFILPAPDSDMGTQEEEDENDEEGDKGSTDGIANSVGTGAGGIGSGSEDETNHPNSNSNFNPNRKKLKKKKNRRLPPSKIPSSLCQTIWMCSAVGSCWGVSVWLDPW